jgi:14-3-3 protein epsilon
MTEREKLAQEAKEADHFHLYDDMVEAVKKIIKLGTPLSPEERTLFYVSYKGLITQKREDLARNEQLKLEAITEDSATDVSTFVQNSVTLKQQGVDVCNDCLNVLQKDLLPTSPDHTTSVFYTKIEGDFHRYRAELQPSQEERDAARASYQKAFELALQELPITNPLRLNVVLNWGVFEYDINGCKEIGFNLTKNAFDEALPLLQTLPEDQFKETAFVLEFMRENIVMWAQQMGLLLGPPPGSEGEQPPQPPQQQP